MQQPLSIDFCSLSLTLEKKALHSQGARLERARDPRSPSSSYRNRCDEQ